MRKSTALNPRPASLVNSCSFHLEVQKFLLQRAVTVALQYGPPGRALALGELAFNPCAVLGWCACRTIALPLCRFFPHLAFLCPISLALQDRQLLLLCVCAVPCTVRP